MKITLPIILLFGLIVAESLVWRISAAESVEDEGANSGAEDLSEDENQDDPSRIKRQHGNSHPLGNILGSVFNKKFGLIGSLSSVSSSSSSSSSSSKGTSSGGDHESYPVPAHPGKPFDWFTFKKTILASLLQAVKAITGGVIALNGQLVKVKSHLLAAKAHWLDTKGDSITEFGKHVATNAFNSPHHDSHDSSVPVPSAPAASLPSSSGFGNDFTSSVEYSPNYYAGAGAYIKRAAQGGPAQKQPIVVDGSQPSVYLVKAVQENAKGPNVGQGGGSGRSAVQQRQYVEDESENVEYSAEPKAISSNLIQRQFESAEDTVDQTRRLSSFQMYQPYVHV